MYIPNIDLKISEKKFLYIFGYKIKFFLNHNLALRYRGTSRIPLYLFETFALCYNSVQITLIFRTNIRPLYICLKSMFYNI